MATANKKKKKIDEALEASRVSDPLNVRSGGFLDSFMRQDTDAEILKQKERKNIKEYFKGYRPGPGNEFYKGPIQNKEKGGNLVEGGQRNLYRNLATQDAIIGARPGPKKTDRQYEIEQERRRALGGKKPITAEEAEAQVIADREKRRAESLKLQNYQPDEPEFQAQKEMREREQMGAAMNQAVTKLKDPNVEYNESDFEAEIKDAPKRLKAATREKTGDFYVDPTTGFALDLRKLKGRMDRKRILQEAQYLPASTRAQYLANKGIIKKEDIPVDPEMEMKNKIYQIQLANATLKLENEKKKMSPEESKYFDIAKTAISSQNYYLASTMLERAGVKDIDLEKIIANDGKYKASLLKKNGMSKNMENLTGFKPNQISTMRSDILKDWRTQDNQVSGEDSKRSRLLKTYGLPDSEGQGVPDFTQMVDMGDGKKMSQFKASLLSRAADPTQAPVYAQQLAFAASKIPDDTSRWEPQDYEAWLTDSIVYLEMHQRVKNYDQYLRAEAGVVANEEGKTLSGTKAPESKTETVPKQKPEPEPEPEPVPDEAVADEAIETAANLSESGNESLIEKGFENTRNRKEIETKILNSTRPRFAKNMSDGDFLKAMEDRGRKSVQDDIDAELARVRNINNQRGSFTDPQTGRKYTDDTPEEKPRFTTPREYAVWLRKNPKRLRKAEEYYLSTL